MERIKQALEKARQERQMIAGKPAVTKIPTGNGSAPDSPQPAVYTQTQRIEVPKEFLHRQRIIAGIEPSSLTDVYRVLRTKVLQRLRGKGWSAIGVTSPRSGEGKTLTAINLAISVAMEVHWTALLVDADLRSPRIHQFFGLKPGGGLSDHLMRAVPIENLLIQPGIDSLVLLPAGGSLVNSSELLGSPRMGHLVKEFKTRYPSRLVIFDMPAVLTSADTLAFSHHVDAVLLVTEEGKTEGEDLARAISLLKDTPIIGTVLNKASQAASDYN